MEAFTADQKSYCLNAFTNLGHFMASFSLRETDTKMQCLPKFQLKNLTLDSWKQYEECACF